MRCRTSRCTHAVVLAVVVVVTLWILTVSSWNVCRSYYDDDVDALTAEHAARSSSSSSRKFAKNCLSPVTETNVRVNFSVDSDVDMQRFNVGASSEKPYVSIIHVMWTTDEVPTRWKRSANSCVDVNPKFVYCHWTDAELVEFVAAKYPWFLTTYLNYQYHIQRSDSARYLLLYSYGGTYVDLDVICRKPLAVILREVPAEAGVVVAPTDPFGVTNEWMSVRRAGDPVMRRVVAGLRRAATSPWYPPLPYAAVMLRSGCIYFSQRLRCGDENGTMARVFTISRNKYYRSYVSHTGGSSWHSWDGHLIWKLFLMRRWLLTAAVLLTTATVCMCVFRNRRLIAHSLRHEFLRDFRNKCGL